jgi:hypothetical protein
MPDIGKASEFGGKVGRVLIQPIPHVPTPSERLMLMYISGDDSGQSPRDKFNETFEGLLPEEEQRARRIAEGVQFEGGEVFETMRTEAEAAIAELAQEG